MNAIVLDPEAFDGTPEFFAPVSSDLVDTLMGEYERTKAQIVRVSELMEGEGLRSVVGFFSNGNGWQSRHDVGFGLDGALKSLYSHFWDKAIRMTDLMSIMPEKRREEWRESIRKNDTPEFTEDNVRATLEALLADRLKFFAERVDGVFRRLSPEHVTNAPEAFGKRMILAYVFNQFGSSCGNAGYITDLRGCIAKFMGRDEPDYRTANAVIEQARETPGKWVVIDGGALRVRGYLKGTCHIEVHPDMAWRLNMVLHHLYPAAIPAQFRTKPTKAFKEFKMYGRPLPFAVLSVLDESCGRYRGKPDQMDLGYNVDKKSPVIKEAIRIIEGLGGVYNTKGGYYEFDYPVKPVIREIVLTGCVPDQQAHQFYPTPDDLADMVVSLAGAGHAHWMEWLEPQAGMGALADRVMRDYSPLLTCVEISPLHAAVLRAKGHTDVVEADFLTYEFKAGVKFNRIVMNPPFSEGRWLAHLQRAAALLSPVSRLVAILPASAKGKDVLPGLKCTWHGPYDNRFPGTSVSVVILVAERENG